MIKLFFLFLVLLLSYSCKSQMDASNNVIIDPVTPSSYELEYKSNLQLPDSLGGANYTGMAAIQGRINNDNLKIENLKIMKLLLSSNEGDTIINYYYGMDSLSLRGVYPREINKYLLFFKDYVNNVKVNRIEGIESKNVNQVTMILRFK